MTENGTDDLPQVAVGILGGTGLYNIEGIEVVDEVRVATPFGEPSDLFFIGEYEGANIAFLSRHGRGHRLLPAEINYQANIYACKMLGAGSIISINSVGSLKEDIRPRDVVIPDQFFDRTRRKNSFFGQGVAAHVSMAEPVCASLAGALSRAGESLGLRIHPKGTYVCIEGPTFSTKAESGVYRSWDFDVIGMTSATEAKLCREAEICYASVSLITDYDVWHESEGPVSVEKILENVAENSSNAKALLREVIPQIAGPDRDECSCSGALEGCILTDTAIIPQQAKEKLRHILEKYLGQ
jgi:5'-methylthioadenosine phosphorylase